MILSLLKISDKPIVSIEHDKKHGNEYEKGIHLTNTAGNEHYFFILEKGFLAKISLANKSAYDYKIRYNKIFNKYTSKFEDIDINDNKAKKLEVLAELKSIVGPSKEIYKLFNASKYSLSLPNEGFFEGTGAIAGGKSLCLECSANKVASYYFYDLETDSLVKCSGKPDDKEKKIQCDTLAGNVLNRETGKFELDDLNDPKALNIREIPMLRDKLRGFKSIWRLRLELGDPVLLNGTGVIAGRRGLYLKGNGNKNYFWDLENRGVLVECDAQPNGKEVKCEKLKGKIFNIDTNNFDLDNINKKQDDLLDMIRYICA